MNFTPHLMAMPKLHDYFTLLNTMSSVWYSTRNIDKGVAMFNRYLTVYLVY